METSPRNSRRSTVKAILVLLLVFLLGNLTGIGASTSLMLKRLQANVRQPETSHGAAVRLLDRAERKLDESLDLSPSERADVHGEFMVTRQRLAEIRLRMIGELRRLSHDTVERVSRRIPESKRGDFRRLADERLRPWGFAP